MLRAKSVQEAMDGDHPASKLFYSPKDSSAVKKNSDYVHVL